MPNKISHTENLLLLKWCCPENDYLFHTKTLTLGSSRGVVLKYQR